MKGTGEKERKLAAYNVLMTVQTRRTEKMQRGQRKKVGVKAADSECKKRFGVSKGAGLQEQLSVLQGRGDSKKNRKPTNDASMAGGMSE